MQNQGVADVNFDVSVFGLQFSFDLEGSLTWNIGEICEAFTT